MSGKKELHRYLIDFRALPCEGDYRKLPMTPEWRWNYTPKRALSAYLLDKGLLSLYEGVLPEIDRVVIEIPPSEENRKVRELQKPLFKRGEVARTPAEVRPPARRMVMQGSRYPLSVGQEALFPELSRPHYFSEVATAMGRERQMRKSRKQRKQ